MANRDEKGRFLQGHPGGPGRPSRETEDGFLGILRSEVKPDLWRKVVGKALEQAVRGDYRARQWLSAYLLPRPENLPPPPRLVQIEGGDWRAAFRRAKEKGLLLSAADRDEISASSEPKLDANLSQPLKSEPPSDPGECSQAGVPKTELTQEPD